ncbi:MAG: glycosyltransferase family 2 protein, partial [Nitrososphaera sp.]|nr:glycosyltransferase family 2 protein [Nitrososphaera sp.]
MAFRISVIIPAYNRVQTIRRAVQSTLDQTYTDIEVIVVDDASTDGTVEAVEAIKDPRIKVHRLSQNAGPSHARNCGIRLASGELVAFLDSDDAWLPRKLEKQVRLFAQKGERCGLVYSGALFFKGRKRPIVFMP